MTSIQAWTLIALAAVYVAHDIWASRLIIRHAADRDFDHDHERELAVMERMAASVRFAPHRN